ncbi:oligopeptide/dipeptide ABC transporter, ATPase subunit [Desulforamulus reducens MI-1]|uniref:Nickel import system ATP-binding protein NikD n=1 Tax=Desulforamulus reducens (strain ATCC BAA-1160 / DSM 100696 / MI-1) TaxID=349161 RepID=A4J4U0_DESRM|nr:ABC transporter ATP-binding protein [Desulforamulus reducens]ABO50093.1 oligopeptide/dipeptide ABC transporter, ATPase subunit [Desulforamulus reducens MI-1]
MSNPILAINNLRLWYRTYGGYSKVLDGVNFRVHKGEKVGLVGEAGCGKTTTMRSVLRILPEKQIHIPEGEIIFQGQDILKLRTTDIQEIRTKKVAMIFQEPAAALNPVFTIGTQMFDIIRYSDNTKTREQIKNMALEAIKEVYIPDPERILDCYPNQLSGGMKQRICIAMAIMTRRELLIADEPGTALDVTIQDQVHRLLSGLVDKKGVSLVMITHSLGVAREITDRIYVMYAGNIVEVANTKDLFARPLHPYTLGLMDSVPRLTGGGLSEGIYGRIPNYLQPPTGCRFHPRCPRAVERCREERPVLYDLGDGHGVACFRI